MEADTHAPPSLRVKVIDCGLALTSGVGATGGQFHGAAQWASPEQLREAPRLPKRFIFVRADSVVSVGEDSSQRPISSAILLSLLTTLCVSHPYDPVAEPVDNPAAVGEAAGPADFLLEDAGNERYLRMTCLHHDLAGEWLEAELVTGGALRQSRILRATRHAPSQPGERQKFSPPISKTHRHASSSAPNPTNCQKKRIIALPPPLISLETTTSEVERFEVIGDRKPSDK